MEDGTVEEYNLLTQRLLAEGYTVDTYPDYVYLPESSWGKDPLQNSDYGFRYKKEYLNQMVFKTGCGLFVRSSQAGRLSYMGVDWMAENDNPVLTCPYHNSGCALRDPLLWEYGTGLVFCNCHRTEEPYEYEKSIEKVCDDAVKEKRRRYDEFCAAKGGHVCEHLTWYDEYSGEWKQRYDPFKCAEHCSGGKFCNLTHKYLSKRRGNVFYDVKVSYVRHDGTVFDGEEVVTIYKGIRLFKTSKSMTICEAAARRKREIHRRQEMASHTDIYLRGWKVEILNIRAGQKDILDSEEDLRQKKAGIRVIHVPDSEKIKKAEKKERREKAKKKRIERLEKKLLETGYENLESYSLDRIHADKCLGKERILELEARRVKEEQEALVQMGIGDFFTSS